MILHIAGILTVGAVILKLQIVRRVAVYLQKCSPFLGKSGDSGGEVKVIPG